MDATQPVLRPKRMADIIDDSLRIYRHNFAPILGISAVIQIPIMVMTVAAQSVWLSSFFDANTQEIEFEQVAVGLVGFTVVLFVAGLVYPLGQAALAIGISDRYLGKNITVGDAYSRALPLWGRALWTGILYYLVSYGAFFGGLILLIIPGAIFLVIVAIRYLFAPSLIVVLEGTSGVAALKRSWGLTEGHFWHVFGTIAILGLMVTVIVYGVTVPLQLGLTVAYGPEGMMRVQIIYQVVTSVLTLLLQPVWMIGIVLLYYDMRIRREGFDLMMMARALGSEVPKYTAGAPQEYLYGPAEPVPPPSPTEWRDLSETENVWVPSAKEPYPNELVAPPVPDAQQDAAEELTDSPAAPKAPPDGSLFDLTQNNKTDQE